MEGRHWDEKIVEMERDLNTAICKTTGKTPFEALYGYIPRFNEGLARELTERSETYRIPQEIREEIRDKIEREQVEAKERYDRNRLKNVKYKAGDIVVVKAPKVATGESTKLQPRNKGPFVITDTWPSDTYVIQNLKAKGNSKRITTAHVSQIKIWRGFKSDSENEDESDLSDIEQDLNCKASNNVNLSEDVTRTENVLTRDNKQDCSVRQSTRI